MLLKWLDKKENDFFWRRKRELEKLLTCSRCQKLLTTLKESGKDNKLIEALSAFIMVCHKCPLPVDNTDTHVTPEKSPASCIQVPPVSPLFNRLILQCL